MFLNRMTHIFQICRWKPNIFIQTHIIHTYLQDTPVTPADVELETPSTDKSTFKKRTGKVETLTCTKRLSIPVKNLKIGKQTKVYLIIVFLINLMSQFYNGYRLNTPNMNSYNLRQKKLQKELRRLQI